MNKICFIICWFGELPTYMPIWIKSCAFNSGIDFLLITDDNQPFKYPVNMKHIPFSKEKFIERVEERLTKNPSLKAPYRLCDYRPMYGVIFREELEQYDYWGYCDIDVVFGKISDFLSHDEIYQYEAVFNGGHFSLIKNSEKMNMLYKSRGAVFDYKTVMKRHAVFAFDETTGFQKIAKEHAVHARFGIPYIETESKFTQLRSRMDSSNPDHQAYYWEEGTLVRVKAENGKVYYQHITYIHLQKRKLGLLDRDVVNSESFWITPEGYMTKKYKGLPSVSDIDEFNPYEGIRALNEQASKYKMMKIRQMLKRSPYQIYVRMKQQRAGINAGDGARREMEWNS